MSTPMEELLAQLMAKPVAKPTMETLPADLIIEIAGCRRIYHVTAGLFAQRIQSMPWLVAFHSLGALGALANRTEIANKLRVLRLGSHYIEPAQRRSFDERLENASEDQKQTILVQLDNWRRHFSRQVRYCVDKEDCRALTGILDRLTKLEHVEVTDAVSTDAEVAKRFSIYEKRDGKCFGMEKFARATGSHYASRASPIEPLGNMFGKNTGLGHNFGVLLEALGAAQRPIRSLRAWHWPNDRERDFVSIHYLPPIDATTTLGDQLATSFADLTSVSLMLRCVPPESAEVVRCINWMFLPALAQLAPRLQRLTLAFDDTGREGRQWHDALVGTLSRFARHADLPALRFLDLRDAPVRRCDLLALWARTRRTLREIRLSGISLTADEMDDDAGGHGGCGGRWRRLFADVAKLYGLRGHGGGAWGLVVFNNNWFDTCNRCLYQRYAVPHGWRDCPHTCFTTALVAGEEEAQRNLGLETLLRARTVSMRELAELREKLMAAEEEMMRELDELREELSR
ncbi:ea12124a-941f-4147-860b-40cc1c8107a6 [Thermothielavioides terrestris]|uniref:Ea12124a-941f-4147-860b-40cc1c8107a6 n=1 Tax=Thermothielavioides terrestris TaxID=2587410 RepID=A0A446BGC1_9PEZI|nr:ea12124a-941f-4147-860b-40cc1c8107a6 [Thermothielavioides terrestris]